jgi:hypothetical protein
MICMSIVGPAVIVRAVNSIPLTSSKNVPLPGHAGKFSGELDGAVTSQCFCGCSTRMSSRKRVWSRRRG